MASLTPGTRLGPYEIVSALGAGGMGEVYRAHDSKLNRDVAIKVLLPAVANDPDRLARFSREAQVLASLNHPNIAHIHGIEETDGVTALVLELVEGEDLAQRSGRGAIPLDEALPIARQIADALEAAHEQGLIHRDLKPANIKVRPDGTVKVLDFGLAKAIEPLSGVDLSVTAPPTITTPAMMTGVGVVLGTAAYMSPEQAKGRNADKRSDVWAFGCVLYEMLSGTRAFAGEDVADTLAAVLRGQPDWQRLPATTPAAIRRLLRRCLAKDSRERLHDIADARLEIEDARRTATDDGSVTPRIHRGRQAWWTAAALVAAAIIGATLAWRAAGVRDTPELRVDITTPGPGDPSFALSEDGRMVVFNADGPRGKQLWLRALADSAIRPLTGTEGGQFPFWAPDGRSIGFFADNKLKRVDIDGGRPQPLANVITPAGGTWNRNGTIVYVPNDDGGVFRVPAAGGDAREIILAQSHQPATRVPQFLPDDRHFLFYVVRGREARGVYVGDIEGGAARYVIDADWAASFSVGYLWFVRDGTLFAQRFDPSSLVLSGPLIRVADTVAGGLIGAAFSVSAAGPIGYRSLTGTFAERRLAWFDRSGREVGMAGEDAAFGSNPSLSPDGRQVVLQRTVENNIDIWAIDLERNIQARVTFDPGIDSMPLWSPDGRRIFFNHSSGDGTWVIKHMDGTAPDEPVRVAAPAGVKIPCDWSSDGRLILFKQFDESTSTTDLWVLPLDNSGPARPIARTGYNERDGQFSPDGTSIAYASDESGQPEIYVQPFPGPGRKTRISTDGGDQVRWRRDGKELFYVARDGNLMAVAISTGRGELSPGTPVRLFKTRIATTRSISRQQYVVSADGQRFLIMTAAEFPPTPIMLILNWKPAIRQ